MFGLILRYGLIGGVIVAAPMLYQMLVVGHMAESLLLGYAVMIVSLTTVFLGVKQYRDRKLGGVIRFLPALGVGLGISVVACLMYVVAWEISLAYCGCDFMKSFTDGMIADAKARHLTGAELQKVVDQAQGFLKMYENPFARMAMTFVEMFPVGVLISLVSAALLRNSRFLPARPIPTA